MKTALVLVLICFAATVLTAADSTVSSRRHYTLTDASGAVAYVVTEATDVSPTRDSNTILLQDFNTQTKYVIQHDFDIEHHRSSNEIRDPSGKRYVRIWYSLPSAAKTRKDLLEEFKGNPGLYAVTNPLFTLETPAFTHTAREIDLSHAAEREEWVSQLRQTLDPEFLEGIERMRTGALATPAVEFFRRSFGAWFFHGNCPAGQTLHEVTDQPDCKFDDSFGFPCTDKQRARVAKAHDENRVLEGY